MVDKPRLVGLHIFMSSYLHVFNLSKSCLDEASEESDELIQ